MIDVLDFLSYLYFLVFSRHSGNIPKGHIDIIDTFIIHNPLTRTKNLHMFSLSFIFIRLSAGFVLSISDRFFFSLIMTCSRLRFRFMVLCLMVYHPLWVIQCQSHSSRRTAVMLFKPWQGGLGGSYLSRG